MHYPFKRHRTCYGKDVQLEECTRRFLDDEMCYPWFNLGYEDYKPDAASITQLQEKNGGLHIIAVMGTWCEDTQRYLPQFYKTIDEAKIADNNIHLIPVDRDKRTTKGIQFPYEVYQVPTFILYYRGEEIGRIVESPKETIEKDLAKIYSSHLSSL